MLVIVRLHYFIGSFDWHLHAFASIVAIWQTWGPAFCQTQHVCIISTTFNHYNNLCEMSGVFVEVDQFVMFFFWDGDASFSFLATWVIFGSPRSAALQEIHLNGSEAKSLDPRMFLDPTNVDSKLQQVKGLRITLSSLKAGAK